MKPEEIKVKCLSKFEAVPARSKPGSVGYDIIYPKCASELVMPYNSRRRIDTGIVVRLPEKCWVLLTPRSSSSKKSISFSNTIGVIDPSYQGLNDHILVDVTRGPHKSSFAGAFKSVAEAWDSLGTPDSEGRLKFDLESSTVEFLKDSKGLYHAYVKEAPQPLVYSPGEKFAQMIFIPWYRADLVKEHWEDWGDVEDRGGFGSTGK